MFDNNRSGELINHLFLGIPFFFRKSALRRIFCAGSKFFVLFQILFFAYVRNYYVPGPDVFVKLEFCCFFDISLFVNLQITIFPILHVFHWICCSLSLAKCFATSAGAGGSCKCSALLMSGRWWPCSAQASIHAVHST